MAEPQPLAAWSRPGPATTAWPAVADASPGGYDGSAGFPDLLRMDRRAVDVFVAPLPLPGPRPNLFGGRVAAQALYAAASTLEPDRLPHSCHCYFLASGRIDVPVHFHVERLRDGRSFGSRQVIARQDGAAIFVMSANFQVREDGPRYEPPMPEGLADPDSVEVLAKVPPGAAELAATSSFELRDAVRVGGAPVGDRHDGQWMWARSRGPLPDDALVQYCALVFVSDMRTGGAAVAAVDENLPDVQMTSLDHTVWLHRPIRPDEWFLVEARPLGNAGARGLVLGVIHDRHGSHAATFAQELLTRPRRSG